MSEHKFEETLIAWVNCIHVAPPINDIAELKDGLFYLNLMKEIKKDSKDEIADNVCVALINFLKSHYLDKDLYENVKNFYELTNNDIIIITALLLHYTSIIFTKEKFQKAMCDKLSGFHQIWIKEFLERFDNIKNYNEILKFNIKGTLLNQEMQNKSNSPLNDYFQTPIRRRVRLVEKDKQMKNLLMELDMERTEKLELLDELKTEQNKVKTITFQLKEKIEEAKKIRCDLYALQAKTPPRNNMPEINDIRRRYNCQIETLEMLTSQLQDEVDKLQISNRELTTKLEKKEIEATQWVEKYVTVQTEYDTIQEQYKSQNSHLQSLQVQCDELNALLQEYKVPKSHDESSIHYSNTDELCDRLGCALTLAELEEMTKQRDDIKLLLKESLDKELTLNTEINNYKAKLENTDKEYSALRKDNDMLTMKLITMNELESDFKELNLEYDKISNDLTQTKDVNRELNEELTSLRVTFDNIETKFREKEDYCKIVVNDLDRYKNECDTLNNKLDVKRDEINELTEETLLLHTKYTTNVDKFNKTSFELDTLTKTFNELDINIGLSLDKLQNIIFEETPNETRINKIEFLNKLIDRLVLNKEATLNERKQFLDKINNLELIGKELENQIVNLNEARDIDIQEKCGLNYNIKCLESHVEELKLEIDVHLKKINDVENTIKNMSENINDLEVLKENLTKDNNELKGSLIDRDIKLNDMTTLQNQQKSEIDKMQNNINTLQLKTISQVDRITQLEEDLTIANGDIEKKTNELEEINKFNEELKVDYETTLTNLTKKVNVLTTTINEIEREFASKVKENEEIRTLLEDQLQKYKELESHKESLLQEHNDLSKRLNLELDKLVVKELEISDNNKTILLHEDNINTLKSSIEAKDVALKNLQQHLDSHEANIEILQNNIQQISESKEHLHLTLMELQQENGILKELKQTLEDKNNTLEDNLEKLFKELTAKNEELCSSIRDLNAYKENTTIEIQNQQKKLIETQEQLENMTNDYKMSVSGNEKEIKELNDKIKALAEEKDVLVAKEIEKINELQQAKGEINEHIKKYTMSLQTQQEIKQEHDTHIQMLTENVHDLLEKYNKLKEQAELEKGDSQTNLDELKKSNHLLESQLSEEKLLYENHFKEMENQLNIEINELKEKQMKLENETKTLREELETSDSNKIRLEKEIDEIATKLKEITTEKAELQRRHLNLNDNYSKMITHVENMQKEHSVNVNQLEQSLEEMKTERLNLMDERKHNEGKQVELKGQIDELMQQVCKIKAKKESLMNEKNNKIKEHLSQIEILEKHIGTLAEENSYLTSGRDKAQEQIKELATQSEMDNVKIREYDAECTKYKIAHDLLETCKNKLETDCENLMKNCHVLRDEKDEIKRNYDNELQLKLIEISNLNDQMNYYEECNNVKDQNIIMLQANVKDLEEKLQRNENKVDALLHDNENLEEKIKQLKEQFEAKLCTKDLKIEELQVFHNVTSTDLINLKTDNLELKNQIDDYLKNSEMLKDTIAEKESIITLLNEQKDEQDVRTKNIAKELTDVTEKFNANLQELRDMKNEKCKLQIELNKCLSDVEKLKRSRDELMDNQTKMIKETENNILRAHNNAVEVKTDLLKRIEMADEETLKEKELRDQLETLLTEEKKNKDVLNNRMMELECEKNKMINILKTLSKNLNKLSCLIQEKPITFEGETIDYDVDALSDIIADIEYRITDIFKRKRELSEVIRHLEVNKDELDSTIKALNQENVLLNDEKRILLNNYDSIQNEKISLEQLHEKDNKSLQLLDVELRSLREKYETLIASNENNDGLREEKVKLEESMDKIKQEYQTLIQNSKMYKDKLKHVWKSRNNLEDLINKVKPKWIDIEMKTHQITESSHRQIFEKKESLAFIFDNFVKEYLNITKNIYNANILLTQFTETRIEQILLNNFNDTNPFQQINIEDIEEKIDNCKDTVTYFTSQLEEFKIIIEKCNVKKEKFQKENVNPNPQQHVDISVKEEEWRKKNLALKQRLTISDNTKSIFEKKLKQLREENKRLIEKTSLIDNDNLYSNLLREYNEYKKENDKRIEEYDKKYVELFQDFETFKRKNAIVKSEKVQQQKPLLYSKNNVSDELKNLRDAYSNVKSENSRLDLENSGLLKKLDDGNKQIKHLQQIKNAYEKLLEEHNNLRMSLDLIQYNSSKEIDVISKKFANDRNALVQSFAKEKTHLNVIWEEKLEKMREKMTRMFKDEMESEILKRVKETDRNEYLLTTVEELKEDLKDAKLKIQRAEIERNRALEQLQLIQNRDSKKDLYNSRESISSNKSFKIKSEPIDDILRDSISSLRNEIPTKDVTKSSSIISDFKQPIDRKISTTRNGNSLTVIKENQVTVATSMTDLARDTVAQSIKMEDEGEMFNNKYLNDLQSGICTLPRMGRESTSSRLSELAWRNSLVPAHLKSSYPAETQFSDPRRFKDDDLKTGNVDLNDSMSTKLLPHEKSRKKDFGTTSYNRPGPPTPSKNGGRPSLQENEILHSQNESKTPKRTTPNRLKSLFKKRNSGVCDTSENLSSSTATPKARRLSFFRKH